MKYTFKELGINISDYDGMHVSQAIPEIINHAANMITLSAYGHPMTSVEALYNWPATIVDLVQHTVTTVPASFEVWEAVNN